MKQVGGDHYENMAIEPWEIIEKNDLNYWEGNIIKYILRHRRKGGVEDLEKAKHYLDHLIEMETKHDLEPDEFITSGRAWDLMRDLADIPSEEEMIASLEHETLDISKDGIKRRKKKS